jgi:hypothetical protein
MSDSRFSEVGWVHDTDGMVRNGAAQIEPLIRMVPSDVTSAARGGQIAVASQSVESAE